eukprot:349903-Chlamydomonas_euryale.AAC.3
MDYFTAHCTMTHLVDDACCAAEDCGREVVTCAWRAPGRRVAAVVAVVLVDFLRQCSCGDFWELKQVHFSRLSSTRETNVVLGVSAGPKNRMVPNRQPPRPRRRQSRVCAGQSPECSANRWMHVQIVDLAFMMQPSEDQAVV